MTDPFLALVIDPTIPKPTSSVVPPGVATADDFMGLSAKLPESAVTSERLLYNFFLAEATLRM